MELHDYASQDATGLAHLIDTGQVSSSEVHAAARTALDVVNPHLNALAEDPFEALDHDADGPFRGVPFGIKDSSPGAIGITSDYACRALNGYVPTSESNVMRRFRSAGLATICRTTAPELHMYWVTESDMHGITRNPWNTDMTSGGSSGGSASLVAARALPMASAGDAGGSTRMPAAFTGTIGLLPTTGRISYAPGGERLYGLSRPFGITRTMRDTATLLDHMSGPMPGDRNQVAPPARPFADELNGDVAPLRIGVWTKNPFTDEVDQSAIEAALATGRALEAMGHDVFEVEVPLDAEYIIETLVQAWSCGLASAVEHTVAAMGLTLDESQFEPNTWLHIKHGFDMTVGDALGAYDRINEISRPIGAFFNEVVDLVVAPSLPRQAIPVGVWNGHYPFETLQELYETTERVFGPYMTTWNLTGQPAISLPLHHDDDTGMPVGTQLVAPWGQDGRLIAVGAALEQALPWRDRIAPIDAAMS